MDETSDGLRRTAKSEEAFCLFESDEEAEALALSFVPFIFPENVLDAGDTERVDLDELTSAFERGDRFIFNFVGSSLSDAFTFLLLEEELALLGD